MIFSVVAGGWSVTEWDLARIPGRVIAVNDSALYLPEVHVIVSMDRMWAENRWEWLKERKQITYLRRTAIQNLKPQASDYWLRTFECDHTSIAMVQENEPGYSHVMGMSSDRKILNGTNSGMCALNLAYREACQGDEVWIFGFDMCKGPNGQAHWYKPYSWNVQATGQKQLSSWANQFNVIERQFKAKGVKVRNASSRSLIKNFPRVTFGELVA